VIDLDDRLAEQGIKGIATEKPGNHKVPCPQCSHTRKKKGDPCLSVTIDGRGGAVWKCHHCGWDGGASESRRDRPIYKRPDPNRQGTKTEKLYDWFGRRGISAAIVDRYGITFKRAYIPGLKREEWAIAFPYWRGGQLINVKYRTVEKDFAQEKDAEPIFYGLDDIKGDTAVIVEGECDKLAFAEAGVPHAISVPAGAPADVAAMVPPIEQDKRFAFLWNSLVALQSVEKFVIATDNDGPGHALAEELARRLGKERCWRVTWPALNDIPVKDANDVLLAHGPEVLREMVEAAEPWPIDGVYVASASDLLALRNRPVDRGLSTGWPGLDEFYRIVPGHLSVISGVPNSGKSEFLDALMVNLASEHGWRFVVCSLENPPDDHAAKLVEKHVGQPFRSYGWGKSRMADADVAKGAAWVAERFRFLVKDTDDGVTLDWILDRARALVTRFGARGLVIDPYNELEHQRPREMTETEYIGALLARLKRFGRTNGVHVWIVAHPAKPSPNKPQGKRPEPLSLYDISASANWANKADFGVIVHRAAPKDRKVTIYVRKARFKHVGRQGDADLEWTPDTGRYTEPAKADGPQYSLMREDAR
jgi:twinkle protein